MKKLNRKGFTLIELLAVITIMGILMLVAIPAVSRTINNTRRDMFADTAKQYISAVRQAVVSDSIECYSDATSGDKTAISALANGDYYYSFNSGSNSGQDLLEQGGKSSWSNLNVQGYIKINKAATDTGSKYTYSIVMVDGTHGIGTATANPTFETESNVKRSAVKTSGKTYTAATATTITKYLCSLS